MTDQAIPFTGVSVTGVSELALEVPDLAEAERFYVEVLGLPVVERWTEKHPARAQAVWLMAGERARIALWEPMVGLGGAWGGVQVQYVLHLAASAFDAALERIRGHGVDVVVWDYSPYGHGPGMTAYLHDPAGHCVELWPWEVSEHTREYERAESSGMI